MPSKRRDFLLASTSVLGCVGGAAAAVPFLVSWQPNARARALGAPIKIDLSRVSPGQMVVAEWRGKPIYILHRSSEQIRTLEAGYAAPLADPESALDNQPDYVRGPSRALDKQYTVVVGLCTHLGCAPKYRSQDGSNDLGADWRGGFFCPCHGSKFDLAGRVYRDMPASPNNLEVPPHRYADGGLLIVGEHATEEGV